MTCRRAFDVDLAAFLRDPRAPELADFVDHYPRCPDCAAEVRAWTEVHLALAQRHPAPAELLAHRDGTLAAGSRARVARHLATCSSCAEELRALERFDAVARGEAGVRAGPAAMPHHGALRRVGHVLWHPAVAYAVALALLVPVLAQRRWELVPDPATAPRVELEKRETAVMHDVADDLAATPPPHRPAAGATASAPAPGPPAQQPAAAARETRPPAPAAPPRPVEQLDDERTRGFARELSRAAGPGPDAAKQVPAAMARARPDPRFDAATGTLTIPVAESARGAGTIEVRLRDATGTRELRERLPVPAPGLSLVLHVPDDWGSPGRWEIELHAGDRVIRSTVEIPEAARR